MNTLHQVLSIMPIVAHRGWKVHPKSLVIRDAQGACPLCALAQEVDPAFIDTTAAGSAAGRLGLVDRADGLRALDAIVGAADGIGSPVRQHLLEALGLEPSL